MELEISAGERRFTVTAGEDVQTVNIAETQPEMGVFQYQVSVCFSGGTDRSVTLAWEEPMRGVPGFWSPKAGRDRGLRQWWAANENRSSFLDGAPVMALFGQGGENYRTVSLSEAVLPTLLTACVDDFAERDALRLTARLFFEDPPAGNAAVFELRVDARAVPLAEAVNAAARRWEHFYPPKKERPGETAGDYPLYSTWYAYHQHPTQAALEKDLDLAAELGFRALIIDDGWSYAGEGTGDYRFSGTWEPDAEKFPDLAAFIKRAHALGVQVALWLALPFAGAEDPSFLRFSENLLCTDDRMKAGVPDPRWPEVRTFFTDTCADLLRRYGIDGFKLDFLTDFQRQTEVPFSPGMDCETPRAGAEKLLDALSALPGAPFVEFRQYYIGPAAVRYCDLLRVCDCAFDPVTNRIGIVDLRMLGYPPAVHADMLLWSLAETPQTVAAILLNTLFAAPQISVPLSKLPETHLRVLKTYLGYWTAHRELLLHGRISVCCPETNYPCVWAEDEALRITALYAPYPATFTGKPTDLWNAANETAVLLEAKTSGTAAIYDCFGEKIRSAAFAAGAVSLTIPRGGRAEIRVRSSEF